MFEDASIKITQYHEYELYLKNLLKDRAAGEELIKLCLYVFKDGVDFGCGRLSVKIKK